MDMAKTCNLGLGMSGQKFLKLEMPDLLIVWDENYY